MLGFWINNEHNLSVKSDDITLLENQQNEKWSLIEIPDNNQVKVLLKDSHVEVLFFKDTQALTVKAPSHFFSNKLEGLCGN